jgi:hypothetical protein
MNDVDRIVVLLQGLTPEQLEGVGRVGVKFSVEVHPAPHFVAAASRYSVSHDWEDVRTFLADNWDEI